VDDSRGNLRGEVADLIVVVIEGVVGGENKANYCLVRVCGVQV
jgi:hypothetical protein